MATRPQKVRQVYEELRGSLGADVPSYVVLKSAAQIVDIYDGRVSHIRLQLKPARPCFEELPLDEAFADGGWRVLERERLMISERADSPLHRSQLKHELKELVA